MRTLIVWVVAALGLLVPVSIVQVAATFFLMTFFPGFLLFSFVDPREKNPFLFLVCGSAFLTVLCYFCAWFLWFPIPLIVSLLCAIVLEKRKVPLPTIDRRMVYLSGCILFMVMYLYPWTNSVDFYPPGEEMKLHLLYTHIISEKKVLPSNYSPLYPEITHISQPLGFHGVTVLVADASRTSFIPVTTFLGIVLASLGCVSLYFLGKTLFSEEKGLAAAFSFTLLSFVSHQLGLAGSYVVLTGITFQIAAVTAIVKAREQKTRTSFMVAALLCAACFATDLNAFFPLALFFILYLVVNRSLLPVLPAFVLFSLPQLARVTISTPTSLELHFITEWFQTNLFTSLTDIQITVFSLGPLLLIFAILQLFSLKKSDRAQYHNLGLYSIPFFIPVVVGSYLPFWYYFNPSLIFRMLAIPLSVLSGLFILQLKEMLNIRWFLSGLILLSAIMQVVDPFMILPSPPSTVDTDSLAAFEWISQNTPPSSYFCNFTSVGDSSTWIPAVTGRPVFLPFHLYYQGDNVMSRLHLPERFCDLAILKVLPDSAFARDNVEKYGFTYLYVDEKSPLKAEVLLRSPLYEVEFNQGDVYIFSVREGEPAPCEIVRYQLGRDLLFGYKGYFDFSNLEGGDVIGVYYTDEGFGNVDVEINGKYVGTVFRFDTKEHFLALFLKPPARDITVSFLPYKDVFFVDYVVILECSVC